MVFLCLPELYLCQKQCLIIFTLPQLRRVAIHFICHCQSCYSCISSSTRQGGEGAGGRLASLTALQQSMLLLAESLDSGAIGGQFEQLYRRNQGLAITECHLPANAAKNRRVSILFKTYLVLYV